MLAAPTRSRWPLNPQETQRKARPLGWGPSDGSPGRSRRSPARPPPPPRCPPSAPCPSVQCPDQMGAPPVAKPQVLAPAHVAVADPLGVPDPKRPHPMVNSPGDDRLSRLRVGLADAPAVAGLPAALGAAQLAPAPGSPLAPAR